MLGFKSPSAKKVLQASLISVGGWLLFEAVSVSVMQKISAASPFILSFLGVGLVTAGVWGFK